MSITCLGVIPARFPSQRLPGKPLKDIAGKTLLERVWRQALKASSVSHVVIATDDQRISDHAQGFGAEVVMTSDQHLTGTDRVAEVARIFAARGKSFPLVANIQGDMPFINPLIIDRTIRALHDAPNTFGMSTIATSILSEEIFVRPDSVKVVVGAEGRALYFSRSAVPHIRDLESFRVSANEPFGYKHMGLYVFRPETLQLLSTLPPALSEQREKLEQLRALSHGVAIKVTLATEAEVNPAIEVDTPDDLERARKAAVEFDRRSH